MNVKEQQYVCELARCRNLTKAAQNLFISQPALSIYISNLENSLGVKLFERIGKSFILTYAGERYVETAKKMLDLNEGFEQELQEIVGEYKGCVRLGMQTRRSAYFLPPLIAAYEKEFEHITVDIRTGNYEYLCRQLKEHQLDLIICNRSDADMSAMKVYPIFEEMLLIAVPVCHPLNEKAVYVPGRRYRYLDIACLQGETLILQRPMQSIRRDVDRLLRERQVVPGRIRELESIETAMQFVAENLGVGFNREGYSYEMSYNKRVNYYGILNQNDTVTLMLAHRKNLALTKPICRMIDMLLEWAGEYYQQN